MNKKLNAKELLIIGICLVILCGLVGNISPGFGGLLLVGGLICIIAAPFNIKKRSSEKDNSKKGKSSSGRDWEDLE